MNILVVRNFIFLIVIAAFFMAFILLIDGMFIANAEGALVSDIRYTSVGDDLISTSDIVAYADKQTNDFSLAAKIPAYYYENALNVCVPVAAGNIVAYFDRYNTELIADYTPGSGIGNIYFYKSASGTEINNMFAQLCQDMGTNVAGAGNTVTEFKSGLEKYCTRAGYNAGYVKCTDGNDFDYDKVKSYLQANKYPVIIFVQSFSICSIGESGGSDSYNILSGRSNHVMSVFGYVEITYEIKDGSIKHVNFLQVATGLKDMPEAYLIADDSLHVTDAYAIHIE